MLVNKDCFVWGFKSKCMDLMKDSQETKREYCQLHFYFYTSATDEMSGRTFPATITDNSIFDLGVYFLIDRIMD